MIWIICDLNFFIGLLCILFFKKLFLIFKSLKKIYSGKIIFSIVHSFQQHFSNISIWIVFLFSVNTLTWWVTYFNIYIQNVTISTNSTVAILENILSSFSWITSLATFVVPLISPLPSLVGFQCSHQSDPVETWDR